MSDVIQLLSWTIVFSLGFIVGFHIGYVYKAIETVKKRVRLEGNEVS